MCKVCTELYRSSPFRSTLNTSYIRFGHRGLEALAVSRFCVVSEAFRGLDTFSPLGAFRTLLDAFRGSDALGA